MITNICVLCLNNDFAKHIAKLLSDTLEMFYADVLDLLEFDLINLVEAKEIVGADYLIKQEKSKIKTIATYDNTIITLDYKSLNNEENFNNLHTGAIIVYLKLSAVALKNSFKNITQEKQLDLNLRALREETIIKKADIIIDVKSLKEDLIMKKIIGAIEKYYEHR